MGPTYYHWLWHVIAADYIARVLVTAARSFH